MTRKARGLTQKIIGAATRQSRRNCHNPVTYEVNVGKGECASAGHSGAGDVRRGIVVGQVKFLGDAG
jgi:hypothetical protein